MRSNTSADAGRSSSSETARSAASKSARDGPGAVGAAMTGLFESQAPRPLADRLRPQALDEVVGQDHLLAPEGPVGRMVGSGRLASLILWGPPGCGKTTIARLLAAETDLEFEPLSAVFSGAADLRQVFERARQRRLAGRGPQIGKPAG